MILNIIRKLFGRKEPEYKPYAYIERDTECDKCEFLNECKNDGCLVSCTRLDNDKEHYIRGIGSNCKKRLR